jgi:hypothetical protein
LQSDSKKLFKLCVETYPGKSHWRIQAYWMTLKLSSGSAEKILARKFEIVRAEVATPHTDNAQVSCQKRYVVSGSEFAARAAASLLYAQTISSNREAMLLNSISACIRTVHSNRGVFVWPTADIPIYKKDELVFDLSSRSH